jgi:serine/threonine-protein kinase
MVRIAPIIALLVLPASAIAQDKPPAASPSGVNAQNAAAAEALFEQARGFMRESRFAEACPRLAESYRIDPALGTLLYLADCYEKNGQTASAWATFTDASALARARGEKDRDERAKSRIQALVPKLSKLTITVAPQNETSANLEVKRDGIVVGKTIFGAPVPVDPGDHMVEASAPGKKPWKGTVNVPPQPGGVVAFAVPPLENDALAPPSESAGAPLAPAGPQAPAAPSTPLESDAAGGPLRTTGLVVGGVGIAGLAVGAALGFLAKSKNDEALDKNNCPSATQCYDTGIELTNQAKSFALGSTVSFAVGGVLVAAGTGLFVYSMMKKTPSTGASHTTVSITPGGLVLRGQF